MGYDTGDMVLCWVVCENFQPGRALVELERGASNFFFSKKNREDWRKIGEHSVAIKEEKRGREKRIENEREKWRDREGCGVGGWNRNNDLK